MEVFKKEKGAITLEAAIVVPMFIMLMLFINGFFMLFMGQQIMSHALIQSAKSMAYDPYGAEKVTTDDATNLDTLIYDMFVVFSDDYVSSEKWYEGDTATVASVAKKRFLAYLEKTRANELLKQIGVQNGKSGISFAGSSVDSEKEVLTLKLKYTQEFVFNTFDLGTFDRELKVKVKLFKYKS